MTLRMAGVVVSGGVMSLLVWLDETESGWPTRLTHPKAHNER